MWFCGIDWADEHHDALTIDEKGQQAGSIRVAHTPEGLSQLDAYLQRMIGPSERSQMACIVPRDAQRDVRLVKWLLRLVQFPRLFLRRDKKYLYLMEAQEE
jgi:Transposase